MVGHESVFECSTNFTGDIVWYYSAPATSSLELVSAGKGVHKYFAKRYAVDNNDKHFNLKIQSNQPLDAGTYRCQDAVTKASAELVLIGTIVCYLNILIFVF